MMTTMLWIAGIALGLYLIDRVATWAESRGWIYWRKKRAETGAMRSALAELSVLANASAEHVIVAKAGRKFEERQNGDDDPPPRQSETP